MNKIIRSTFLTSTLLITSFSYAETLTPPKCPSVSEIQSGKFVTANPARDGNYYFAIMFPGEFPAEDDWSFVINKINANDGWTARILANKAKSRLSGTPKAVCKEIPDQGYSAWFCSYNIPPMPPSMLEAHASLALKSFGEKCPN